LALKFLHRGNKTPARVAVFPGAWNPPTVAHAGIALAALGWADEVVWVLPSTFPHKSFEGAPFADRGRMIERIARSQPGFSAAISEGGLYAEIAREVREFFGAEVQIGLACGRDAAERIASWDYVQAGVFDRLINDHPLLVAARAGEYEPPDQHRHRIVQLTLDGALDHVSSTAIRDRIRTGQPWRHLVPAAIAEEVAAIYGLDC
jgi:nicotinic acid mononucleotide adenylyltransferase